MASLLIRLFSASAIAAMAVTTAHGADDKGMSAGITAFNQGNFVAAARAFEDASAAGYDHPSLFQNLGSVYYRLGDYNRAADQFMRLAQFPAYQQLAYYNLGLVANRQNDESTAASWFRRAIQTPGSKSILQLSQAALATLEQSNSKTPRLGANLAVEGGYDGNVRGLQDNLVNAASRDFYTDFSALGYGRVLGDAESGMDLTVGMRALNYSTVKDYGYLRPSIEIAGYRRLRSFDFGASAAVENYASPTTNRTYETINKVSGFLLMDVTDNSTLSARYVFNDIQMSQPVDIMFTGNMHQTRADYTYYSDWGRTQLRYELEINDRNDSANQSYSPIRHWLRLAHEFEPRPNWRLTVVGGTRNSIYPSVTPPANVAAVTATNGRTDTRYTFGGELRWQFNKKAAAALLYDYTNNDSTLPANYNFQRHLAAIVVAYKF